MATRPNPYVKKDPGDIMLAADWNEMQVQAREELRGHHHTGGADAEPIMRAGIAPGAVDGSRIDPQADVALKSLKINGRGVLEEIDALLASVKGLGTRLQVNGPVRLAAQVDIGGPLVVSGVTAINGGLGLGTATPRTALDTGSGLMSGAANDYQKAQFALSGGGLVTWSATGHLKWSNRFIAISAERSKTFPAGYVDIVCPTGNPALVKCWDGSSRATSEGVLVKDWEALYAVHEVGGDQTKVTFQIVTFSSGSFYAPGNWLLVAVVNSDDRTVKLGTGVTVGMASSYTSSYGSSLPRGAIVMWTGDTAPAGWAMCDGQNGAPDLRGRFVLGSGKGNGLTQRNRGEQSGEEKHLLTIAEIPSHTHGVSDPGHLHNWTGSRQQAGTDDHNNTCEFSKGDAGAVDTVSKNTDSRTTNISISAAGGSLAHENMPPFYVLAYIMKL